MKERKKSVYYMNMISKSTNQADVDNEKWEYMNVNDLTDIYNNPVIKAGLRFFLGKFPFFGELIETGIDSSLYLFQKSKQIKLRDTILACNELITLEKVRDVEFISNLMKSSELVSRLSTDEKVVYFGNLVRNGYFGDEKIASDDFDEYVAILNELSYREIQYLVAFADAARGHDYELGGKALDDFCNIMIEKFPNSNPIVILTRLGRTGYVNDEMAWVDDEEATMRLDGKVHFGSGKAFTLDKSYNDFEKAVIRASESNAKK